MAAGAGVSLAQPGLEAGYSNFLARGVDAKHDQIFLWLKEIRGDWFIPFHGVNGKMMDILHYFMECCEARERDVSLLIEDMKHQKAEHEAATKEMQDIFEDLGLSTTSLSREASGCLSSLAKSAVILETKDTSLTCLFCAINNMTSELFEIKQKINKMQWKLDITKKKLASALMLKKQLVEDTENVEECQAKEYVNRENRSQILRYLRDKSLELRIRIKNAERELIAHRLDKSLTHEALTQFSAGLTPLQEKVVSLKDELKTYFNLPFNIALAKVKVQEAERKRKATEDELSEKLGVVGFEMS